MARVVLFAVKRQCRVGVLHVQEVRHVVRHRVVTVERQRPHLATDLELESVVVVLTVVSPEVGVDELGMWPPARIERLPARYGLVDVEPVVHVLVGRPHVRQAKPEVADLLFDTHVVLVNQAVLRRVRIALDALRGYARKTQIGERVRERK